MAVFLNRANNLILNGGIDIWQRGTSFVSVASGTYTADRFQYSKSGTMVHTITRDTDVPSSEFLYSLRATLVTAQASLTTTNQVSIDHKIEGYRFAAASGRDLAISFWVKATRVGVYTAAFRNAALNRSYVTSFTVVASGVWEKKTIFLKHDPSGTWDYTAGIGMYMTIVLSSGPSLQSPTLGDWQSGNFISHSSAVNGVQAGSTEFRIAGVQLEASASLSNFARAGITLFEEERLCRRYFYRHLGVTANTPFINMNNYTTTSSYGAFTLPAQMRAQPVSSSSAFSGFTMYSGGIGRTPNAITNQGGNGLHIEFHVTSATAGTLGHGGWIRMNAGAYVDFDAEL